MKLSLIAFLLLPFFSMAQDCNLKKQVDQFSKQPSITTGFLNIGSDKVSVTADNKELDFFFSLANNSNCFDDASTLVITFEDGRTKSTFRNTGSMNCEGLFHFTIRNTPTSNFNLDRMASKKIKTIRLTNKKEITDITLTEEQQQNLMNMVGCIAKEGKTLIH